MGFGTKGFGLGYFWKRGFGCFSKKAEVEGCSSYFISVYLTGKREFDGWLTWGGWLFKNDGNMPD